LLTFKDGAESKNLYHLHPLQIASFLLVFWTKLFQVSMST